MKFRTVLSKKDVLVTICCLAFLLANLAAIGSSGRERAKRTICLTNLSRLRLAWAMFADDNEGNIVSGGESANNPQYSPLGFNHPEYPNPWCGLDWIYADPEDRIEAMKEGALYPYLQDLRLYKCPAGRPGELRNYSIVQSMNGSWEAGGAFRQGEIIKNRMQIDKPAKRIVFLDEGKASADSYIVTYAEEHWSFDGPPGRHGDGTTFSFADGHTEHWKWEDQRTIEECRLDRSPLPITVQVELGRGGNQDLYRLQIAAWGELGYNPSIPPKW